MVPPKPNGPFQWTQEKWGRALRCAAIPVPHLFSTNDLLLAGAEWKKLAQSLGVQPACVLRPKQVHGADVTVVSQLECDPADVCAKEADIIVTDNAEIAVAVKAADCVPLLLFDRRSGAVAAAHAGWKGTAAGVARSVVHSMTSNYGSRPENLVAAIGPSIGPCCYQVGEELLASFGPEGRRWFYRVKDRLMLNLWKANEDQLAEAGLASENIHLAELCTAMERDLFPSFRRDGKAAGRLVAAIRPDPKN